MKSKKFKFETTRSILSSRFVIDAELIEASPQVRIESEENSEQSLVFARFEHLLIKLFAQSQLSINFSFEKLFQMIDNNSRNLLRKEVI